MEEKMEIKYEKAKKTEIEFGDIVTTKEPLKEILSVCMVVLDGFNSDRVLLVELKTGGVVEFFSNLSNVRNTRRIKLFCKNENSELIIKKAE